MGDLLADVLNNRVEPVPTKGQVNGVMDYGVSDDETDDDLSDYQGDSDVEQKEYIQKEFETYFPRQQDQIDGLTDIDDGNEESLLGTDIIELIHVPVAFDKYKFNTYSKKELPIDSFKSTILNMISTNSVVIIHGPTGCGKTTQVPQYILDQCKESKAPCNIVVTQPRRIAAINIAQRVCSERGWSLGTVCGYQVGLDKNVGEDVILTYMTTEVLLQKLISQKNLNRYSHIIIDEVHERNKSLDFLLLIVRKYLFTNSLSVKVILMSATMDAKDFAYYFRSIPRNNPDNFLPAPILHVNKKSEYETNIYYIEQFAHGVLSQIDYRIDDPCITGQQYEMCCKLIKIFDDLDEKERREGEGIVNGSVLVFLPGYHEIEAMHKLLEEKRSSTLDWDVVPLHSSLTRDQMGKAFDDPKRGCRKIILSTNIAESSLTVSDVKYVIDFCLTKIMTMNESTKFSTLCLQWASRNNCIQRAGRVGRVSNGRVYRLVPCRFYEEQMQESTLPELQRAPLENVILYMKLLDLNDTPKNVLSLAISPPNLKDVEICVWYLKEVGALLTTCRGNKTAADGDMTFIGRIMGSLPIDIRLSKMIILGHMFSCLSETITMAAGCMTRNIFVQNFHDRIKTYRKKLLWADRSCSDFMTLLNLYNVWMNKKRENAFRENEEFAWCKTNFVNMRGLREWDILIKEITNRLKRFHIEEAIGPGRVKLSAVEKPTVLKIIICGAFYPNYFARSSDFGQVDSREAVKVLNGRDPNNTVYFTNMRVNQPGHIYVRQIKQLLQANHSDKVQIGFDGQSTRVFVEFNSVQQPEQVTVEGRQFIATIPGTIGIDVYEAVRKRQMNVPFRLKILPDHKAWAFADLTEERYKKAKPNAEELNCFTAVEYSSLPPLDLEYITVTVTHTVDAGHFYCQNWNDETRMLLDKIFTALNSPGIFLQPLDTNEKVYLNSKLYAAKYNDDNKFYRCQVVDLRPGKPYIAQVRFVDYGNFQKVPANRLYHLPTDNPECQVKPIAMCCVLSEVQPHLVANPKGIWSDEVNELFKKKAENVLLNAKVYSVVDEIAHLELYQPRNSVSFNQYLINTQYGQKCEESQRSKMDHELRRKILTSEDPNNVSISYKHLSTARNYTDFEEPSTSEATDIVELKGPYSPLEMKVCGLIQASVGATVRVDGDSVNAVLLDDNPDDPHARLLVAATVSQSTSGQSIKLSQTTIMPSIPGLPMLVTLLFCPQMEPKLTPDGCRVASILCGLGYKEFSGKPNFPMHDLTLVLDTELQKEIVAEINTLRYYMNAAVKTMCNMCDGLSGPSDLFTFQNLLKDHLFKLLHMRQRSVDRVNVKYADVWNKSLCEGVNIMTINKCDENGGQVRLEEDSEAIWPLLWFVQLKEDMKTKAAIDKNLHELSQIAKRLAPEREIVCELCKTAPLRNISEVRIHLFRQQHKGNLERHQERE